MEETVYVIRRNWIVPLNGLAIAVGGFVAARFTGDLLAVLGALAMGLACIFTPIIILRNSWPLAQLRRFRATTESLWIESIGSIRTEDITSIRRVVRPFKTPRTILELAVRGQKDVTIGGSDLLANELARLIGDRSSRHRILVPFKKRFLLAWLFCSLLYALPLALTGHVDDPAMLAGLFGAAIWAIFFAWIGGLVRGRAVVGTDGIATHWFGRKKFLPFADVKSVEAVVPFGDQFSIDTVLELRNGKSVRFRTPEEPTTNDERGIEGRALNDAVNRAFAESRTRIRIADARTLLARGNQSSKQWLSSLDRLAHASGGYRDMTVDPKTLTEIVADPDAPLDQRVGAAAAIVRSKDPVLLPRIRVAAEATADPLTRDCLLRIGDVSSEEETVQVLERVIARSSR